MAVIAALPSLPLAAASDPAPTSSATSAPARPSTIQAAVRAAAVRDAAVVAAPMAKGAKSTTSAKRAARADQAGPDKQSGSFFRSGAGAVALAVLAVGGGYAIYSATHDKITSPAKQ